MNQFFINGFRLETESLRMINYHPLQWVVVDSEAMKKGLKALDYAKENSLTTINFIWVNSHKGFPINELADHYAKKAVGLI